MNPAGCASVISKEILTAIAAPSCTPPFTKQSPPTQGPAGCASADLAWRREPDGYLKEILTAKVYRIAVETPLQPSPLLSKQLGNEILLKREDLQVGLICILSLASKG